MPLVRLLTPVGIPVDAAGGAVVPRVVALGPDEGELARLVRQLKYGRRTAVVTVLADRLAPLCPDDVDLITWAPASRRRRERGFDQAELLARAVARRRGVAAAALLRRRRSRPQTGGGRRSRAAGPGLVARRRARSRARGRHVLVIDDVCTTGATLLQAASVVGALGARRVSILAVTSRSRRRARGTDPVEGGRWRGTDPVEGGRARGTDPVEGGRWRGTDPVEGGRWRGTDPVEGGRWRVPGDVRGGPRANTMQATTAIGRYPWTSPSAAGTRR